MPTSTYELRLIEDNVRAGAALELPADGINRVVYVVHGRVAVAGNELSDDTAWLGRGPARLAAGQNGAALWRFELAPAGTSLATLADSSGASRVKLTSPLAWPVADDIAGSSGASPDAANLLRADSVAFPPGGCAYLHTHQGPGIRCLIEGGIRIDTDGHSTSYAPGGAWFEAGPIPVFAQAADRATRFIRVMILPARLKGQSSIAYVNAEDRDKPKSQSYKIFIDQPIRL